MTDLLGTSEYKAIAAGLSFPTQAFIDGGFRPALSGKTFTTTNPATGEALAEIAACDARDVDLAVAAARAAFEDGRWSKLHPGERKETLLRLAALMQEHARDLAVLESLDAGKTIFDCETVDVPETIHVIRWHAELIDKIYDQVSPASASHIAMVVREPVGVVGLVLPWNFPLLMLAWKIGPALAAGCSVVLKPAAETTLSTLRVAELAAEAGLPAGVLNIVTGSGSAVGEPLGRHPDVDMVSFTGSTATGRRFLNYSADSNLKEVVLELGGKNPCVVLDDAEDLEAVAAHVVNGAFWNMGQNCSAGSRLIVQRGIRDRLLDKVRAEAATWLVGDPLDPAIRVGSLVSQAHFDKVAGYLEAAQSENILFGGRIVAPGFIEPTVVETARDSKLAVEEIFGPILTVVVVDSVDEAIAVANDTEYGLAASIFSANGRRALRGARALRAGTVTVNSFGEGDVTTPFGGYKQSGFGGRDNSIHAHDQYTQLKTIWIDLTDHAAGD
ncbi:gamma-glutamyl-gamma-aminobutyraldehyde dehydrogenase [Paracoccus aminovorans]|uniref:Gamma-glutamyl-gamma-aminobutyraldehyde dehydrogenase n=1 Tax=Paracoccus aminovorans TaxID=34004 RepID=A0A1I3F239_9RHOB|nr:aldehyde dehydrogenase [Paracoccus aminovorans]CQR84521.1 Aldehyde dehydrogenase PuuC [Paracoccus aminovorans]CQR84927.1 Aldehyde dehydrogenase [Paracoccus aminovorans]SFH81954.1 gamma-glutamyl-gamma-aminobutyraldehyde dehydrogenase [Paracoccus aminovorans]SFI04841.1 gamma-glutamyl-gamma-aminobutyraldehyde dehydrogenase [Paracoccus aminovorans]